MRRRWVWLGLAIVSATLVWLALRGSAPSSAEQLPLTAAQSPEAPTRSRLTEATAVADAGTPLRAAEGSLFQVQVSRDGAPVPDTRLTLSRQQPQSSGYRPTWEAAHTARTDEKGLAELAGSAGTWVLSAEAAGLAPATLDVVKPAGERVTVVRVSLERGFELRGVAIDPKEAAVAPALIRAIPLGERSVRRARSPSGVVETAVDPRGAFRFPALSSGWWRLEGEAEGAGRADPLLVNLPTGEPVKLRFRRSGFLEGVVLELDGGVSPRALVVMVGGDGTDSLETSATGTFSTERMPGAYRVSARSAALGGSVGTAQEVALVRAGATTSTRITLSGSGGTLHGTVKRDDGAPVTGALVVVSPHNEDGVCAQANTGPDGTWSISAFPRGTYDVDASASGLMSSGQRGFFVANQTAVRADLVLGRLGRVKGTAETSTGAPLSVRVQLRSLENRFPERQALADGMGHFAFDDVPPGPAFLRAVRSPGEFSAPTDVKVDPGLTTEAKVVVNEPLVLEVELDRTRCAPPIDVTLVAMQPGPGAMQKRVERKVPAGLTRTTLSLGPGTWRLMARELTCLVVGKAMVVILEAGSKPAPVKLVLGPHETNFKVTVLEADGEPATFASVTVREAKGGLWASSAEADGVVEMEVRADGELTVTATRQGRSGQWRGQRTVGHVVVTLKPAAQIRLRLEGAKGVTLLSVLLQDDFALDELRISDEEGFIEEVPAGRVLLTAFNGATHGVGKTRVVTSAGQTTEAVIRLQPAGEVRGQVQLPAGVTEGMVTLSSPQGDEEEYFGADGRFLFDALSPGAYTAKVTCSGCAFAPRPVQVVPAGSVELAFP